MRLLTFVMLIQIVWPSGSADTLCPPTCIWIQLHIGSSAGRGSYRYYAPSAYTNFEVRRSSRSQDNYDTLSISLLTLTFDHLTLKQVCNIIRRMATFLSISVFLGFCVLDLLASNTCQTHHATSRPWPLTLEVMARLSVIQVFVLHQYTKLKVRRPFHSEATMHFRFQN